jgi:hypothetical protein
MKKTIKQSGIIAISAHCKTCGQHWKVGAVALDALRHHDSTGHHIYVEQTIWWSRASKPLKKPSGTPPSKPS